MTNGDKIRSMTDRELAEIIDRRFLKCTQCPVYHTSLCVNMTCIDCAEKIEKWLKSEVDSIQRIDVWSEFVLHRKEGVQDG